MIPILEKAFEEISKLSEADQEAYARWILEELEDERRWDEAFAKSLPILRELGAKALADYHAGRTEELDPDKL